MNNSIQLINSSHGLAPNAALFPAIQSKPAEKAVVNGWGWLPFLSVIGALGLLQVACADTLARAGQSQYGFLLWTGMLTLILPAAWRLVSTTPARRERIGLVLLVVVGLYLVKVMHSPSEFTFADELVHLYNANSILQSGTLFNTNAILSVTPSYPGLEALTTAFSALSGLSLFAAGIVIIGVARVVLGLALFLLFEEIGGSSRLAGLAVLLYATNANFLYWSAQFSYESLSLPLAVLVIYLALRAAKTDKRSEYVGLMLITMLIIAAIVVTHHLTSYFLVAFFSVWTLLSLARRLKSKQAASGLWSIRRPAILAAFSTLVTLIWLVTVANDTISYLSPVLSQAVASIIGIITGQSSTRQLFQSTTGYLAPLWERFAGIGSVLLMLIGLPLGLRSIWRRFRDNPIALMLAGAALAFFAMLGLRLSPAAWETGNRASEYLFIGLAFVLALAVVDVWDAQRGPRFNHAIVMGSIAVVFVGGVVSGWSPTLRLGRPLQVTVDGVSIKPQGFAAANWMKNMLGPGHTVATDQSNARLLLTYGEQSPLTGGYPDINDLLNMTDFPDWQTELMQQYGIQYLAVDRRPISRDSMEGYYFDVTGGGPIAPADLLAPEVYEKFDRVQKVNRIYDSGNIVIYDAEAILHAPPAK